MKPPLPILPPSTIGIIGGGQLGMMTAREAQRMGYRTIVWDPDPESPAALLADETITAPFSDAQASAAMAAKAGVITYEFENIDAALVATLERTNTVRPGSAILSIAQHRREEKLALRQLGFPTVPFAFATNVAELSSAIATIGFPAVVKTATSGYDGKGQRVVKTDADMHDAIRSLPSPGAFIVEQFIPLQCELSVIVARSADGTSVTFPVAENEHRENILHTSVVPARISEALRDEAAALGRSIADAFQVVGVICTELFVTTGGTLLVNELAPRPHNSGHYTLDACSLSQFEALIRTACGLPLHQPALLAPCAMVNILGRHIPLLDIPALLATDHVKLHLYRKAAVLPGRKMGHLTILGKTEHDVAQRLRTVCSLLGEPTHTNSHTIMEG